MPNWNLKSNHKTTNQQTKDIKNVGLTTHYSLKARSSDVRGLPFWGPVDLA
jgi:hypothetical protein